MRVCAQNRKIRLTMQRELNTLEERVLELISLNDSLRKVNRDLVSQLNKKLDECEVLQKKVDLSKTSLIRIQKKYFNEYN